MEKIKLSEMLAGISSSVQEAQSIIEKKAMQDFFLYFEDIKGAAQDCKPYIRKILIPSEVSAMKKDMQITVPLASVIHHKQMLMDEVVITVHGRLRTENGEMEVILDSGEECTPDEIRLVYKCNDSTEGAAQVIQSLARSIE